MEGTTTARLEEENDDEDDIGRHAAGIAAGSSDNHQLERSAQGTTARRPGTARGSRGPELKRPATDALPASPIAGRFQMQAIKPATRRAAHLRFPSTQAPQNP